MIQYPTQDLNLHNCIYNNKNTVLGGGGVFSFNTSESRGSGSDLLELS